MRSIRLSSLSISQLKAIKNVLLGQVATADSKEVMKLRKENSKFRTLNERWKLIRERELTEFFSEDDEAFIMSYSDDNFAKLLHLFEKDKFESGKEASLAEATLSMRVPRIFGARDLDALDTLREGFAERRNDNGNGSHYEHD